MSIDPEWLVAGSFTGVSNSTPPIMQQVRQELCKRLGLATQKLRIRHYPSGPTLKHCYWWREGRANFEEAQFFAEISRSHPVLSLGLSIEKGRETSGGQAGAAHRKPLMKRADWDWARFVSRLPRILTTDVPAVERQSSAPIYLRIRSRPETRGRSRSGWDTRVFAFASGRWYQRHYGPVDCDAIRTYVGELDQRKDTWVIAHVARDFFPTDAKTLTARRVAAVLMEFDALRRRLRR